MVVDGDAPFRCVFYLVIDDGILSFDLPRCSILVSSTHGFKSNEVELPHDVAVVALA